MTRAALAETADRIEMPSAPLDVRPGPFGGWVVTCLGCGRPHGAHLLSVALRRADDRHWSCQREPEDPPRNTQAALVDLAELIAALARLVALPRCN